MTNKAIKTLISFRYLAVMVFPKWDMVQGNMSVKIVTAWLKDLMTTGIFFQVYINLIKVYDGHGSAGKEAS